MKVVINSKERSIGNGEISVSRLLEVQNVKMPELVSVQLNGDILKRKLFDETYLKENDKVNFLYFMGGGAERP